ncbi:hypothetical protein FQA39_LY10261 [Lamprigera yunnana]|nr:hypothetical protein FQA39_LY10261 [Lamprigera yunnana]
MKFLVIRFRLCKECVTNVFSLQVLFFACLDVFQKVNADPAEMKSSLAHNTNSLHSPQKQEMMHQEPQHLVPVQLVQMQKPFYMPQQPIMLIIAPQAYSPPPNFLYGNPSMPQQQLLSYFPNPPQPKFQLFYGGYQPQPTVQPYIANNNIGASSVPTYQAIQNPFLNNYNHVQPNYGPINQIPFPVRNIPPIITGFENFTPEQQLQIKAQLNAHLGGQLATPATTTTQESMTQNQEKNTQSHSNFTPSLVYRPQYTHGLKRNGMRLITGEKLLNKEEFIEPFHRGEVYNGDESDLFWHMFPDHALVSVTEKAVPGRKIMMSRTNASGNDKLRLLVVGTANKPPAFKSVVLPRVIHLQKSFVVNTAKFSLYFYSAILQVMDQYVIQLLMNAFILLLMLSVALAMPERPTKLEDLENENVAYEQRPKPQNKQKPKMQSSMQTLPQMQFGFRPMKAQHPQNSEQSQYVGQQHYVQQSQYESSPQTQYQSVQQPQFEIPQQSQFQHAALQQYFLPHQQQYFTYQPETLQALGQYQQQFQQQQNPYITQNHLPQQFQIPQYVFYHPSASNSVQTVVEPKSQFAYIQPQIFHQPENIQSALPSKENYQIQYLTIPQVQLQPHAKVQPKFHYKLETPSKQKHSPKSLLDSYVPSILQIQYHKQQMARANAIRQPPKIPTQYKGDFSKNVVVKRTPASHRLELANYQKH